MLLSGARTRYIALMRRTLLLVSSVLLAASSLATAQPAPSAEPPPPGTYPPPGGYPPPGAYPPPPVAYQPPPPPAPAPAKRLGVGYKLGNGIGFLGADLIINVVDHVSLDLHGSYFSVATSGGESGTGYAFAPAIHGELKTGQRSTPYVALGMQYAHLTVGDATGSGFGGFANVGYEWKWQSGFGIQLGGGVQYLQKVEASSGGLMLMTGGEVNPNIEFGLRYMFL
jgi:hypothetical protein